MIADCSSAPRHASGAEQNHRRRSAASQRQQRAEVRVARHDHTPLLIGQGRAVRHLQPAPNPAPRCAPRHGQHRATTRPDEATGSDQREISRRRSKWNLTIGDSIGSEPQRRRHIFKRQRWQLGNNLVSSHSIGNHPNHRRHRNPQPSDTRNPTHLLGIDRDPFHDQSVAAAVGSGASVIHQQMVGLASGPRPVLPVPTPDQPAQSRRSRVRLSPRICAHFANAGRDTASFGSERVARR
jgi:hypothetical protein